MDNSPSVRYRIDTEDRLTDLSESWLAFATANDGHELHPSNLLGHSLWDFIADATTSHLYQVIVQRVRAGGPPVRFRFRCDAPDRRRVLAMDISGDDRGGIWFGVTPVLEEQRPSVALLEPDSLRGEQLLTMCGWCKQIRLPAGEWVETEDAVEVLSLFAGLPLPGLTHGMCPPCYETITGALEDPEVGASGNIVVGEIHEE